MRTKLSIEFEPADGALPRLLGIIERRGFKVRRIAMNEQPCGARAGLSLEVDARGYSRRGTVLAEQLRRVHGVTMVAQTSNGAAQCLD